MPTGYTADVANGTVKDFRTFALRCARAFGALILMRDDPADAPIPEMLPPEDYHARALTSARARLRDLQKMDADEAKRAAESAYGESMQEFYRAKERQAETQQNYRAMIARVQSWTPPTPDHAGLKRFMLEQLEESLRFDAWEPKGPLWLTGPEWLARQVKAAEEDVAYHEAKAEEERTRWEGRNRWVQDLRASLPSEN